MATTLIGTLRPHAKGVHVQANAYNIMDVVTGADGSRAYMAVKDVPAGTALTDAEYWCVYTDLSAVKSAMENASAQALASAASANEAIANLTDYTSEYALRVRGETAVSEGNPVQISPDAGSLLKPVTVFTPVQGGSGDPSPENIRPISGYDALGLTRCGKNLANAYLQDAFFIRAEVYLAAGVTYVLSVNTTASGLYVSNRDLSVNYASIYSAKTLLFTVETTGEYTVRAYYGDGSASLDYNIQLELGSTVTAFEAYRGDTYTIQIGQIIYGGRMDWTSGVLTADTAKLILTGDEKWIADSAVNGVFMLGSSNNASIFDPGFDISNDFAKVIHIVSHYKAALYTGASDMLNNSSDTFNGAYGRTIRFKDNRFTSPDDWAAYVKGQHAAGTPITVCIKLATPTAIQLTPHQILALRGVNALHGDGDTVRVEWVKPLITSIEERVAAAVQAAMANA